MRHTLATLSAHSRMLTKRTAPLSSTTSGVVRRKILIVATDVEDSAGGACVATITRDLDRVAEDSNASMFLSAETKRKVRILIFQVWVQEVRTAQYQNDVSPQRLRVGQTVGLEQPGIVKIDGGSVGFL